MENYFNEMLEYQEGIRASFKQGYKSDWPVTKESEVPAEEPAAQSEDPVSDPDEVVDPATPAEGE